MPQIPEMVTLQLNIANANLILNALADQPWKITNDLIMDLRQQLLQQINPRQESNVTPLTPPMAGE
jgi:hypothetical protein